MGNYGLSYAWLDKLFGTYVECGDDDEIEQQKDMKFGAPTLTLGNMPKDAKEAENGTWKKPLLAK